MNHNIFKENEVFKNMHPVKVKVMKELADKMEGRQMKDAPPLIMDAMNQLKRHNLSFSPEESAMLIEILSRDMSPEEKARVEMMKNIMRKKR